MNPCSGLPLLEKNPTCHKNLAQIKMSLIQPFPMQQLTKMSRHRDWDIACKVYIGNLGNNASKYEIEDAFGKYGPLKEIWMARSVPCFAFVVFRYREDAEESQRKADGSEVCGRRIRVTVARPRTRGRGRRGFDPGMRCYQCGERGHFSRDCPDSKWGYKRPPSPRRSGGRDSRDSRDDRRSRF